MYFTPRILKFILIIFLCSCSTQRRANGFYEIADYPDDRIIGKPIVKIADFERVVIDTISPMPIIEGRFKPSAKAKFADATERLTGHRIGFVFYDSIVMAPQVNCRIESGNFQIISPDTALIKRIYTHIMLSNIAD